MLRREFYGFWKLEESLVWGCGEGGVFGSSGGGVREGFLVFGVGCCWFWFFF